METVNEESAGPAVPNPADYYKELAHLDADYAPVSEGEEEALVELEDQPLMEALATPALSAVPRVPSWFAPTPEAAAEWFDNVWLPSMPTVPAETIAHTVARELDFRG